jgi:dTDP-4-amino-4,6-dideoxygalactose transaminase
VLTSDDAIADKVRRLRNYGSSIKYQHDMAGYNSRLDEIQAAFLRVKLACLDEWNASRRQHATRYAALMASADVALPMVPEFAEPVWHLYVIRSQRRDALKMHLAQQGISTVIHYPTPPHLQACYRDMKGQDLPVAQALADEVLSLPMFPALSDAEIAHVAQAVLSFAAEIARP